MGLHGLGSISRIPQLLGRSKLELLVICTRDRSLISVIKNGIQFYFMVLTVFRTKTIRANFFLTSYLFINL